MKNLSSLVALIFFVTASSSAADFDQPLKTTLEGRYKRLEVAMASRDVAAIRALLTPAFVSEDVDGNKHDADAMMREIAGLPIDPNTASETTLVSVENHGDSAVVIQRYHMTATRAGQDGSPKRIDLVTISRDSWKRGADGTWLMGTTITQQLDYMINDKLVAHKERLAQ